MKKFDDAIGLFVHLVTCLVPAFLGLAGGTLLFSPDTAHAPGVRGIGLMLIVVVPWVLTELTKERPPKTGRKR